MKVVTIPNSGTTYNNEVAEPGAEQMDEVVNWAVHKLLEVIAQHKKLTLFCRDSGLRVSTVRISSFGRHSNLPCMDFELRNF